MTIMLINPFIHGGLPPIQVPVLSAPSATQTPSLYHVVGANAVADASTIEPPALSQSVVANVVADGVTVESPVLVQYVAANVVADGATVNSPVVVISVSPTDVSGLHAWYKADGTLWQDSARTTAATADGDPVGAWDDASGNSRHLLQATSTKRGLLKTGANGINSLPIVRLDGTDDFLATTDPGSPVAQPFTVFAVIKDPGGAANENIVGTAASYANSPTLSLTSTNKAEVYAGTALDSVTTIGATATIVVGVFNGTASSVRINSSAADASGNPGTTGYRGYAYGTYQPSSGQDWFGGDCAEIVIYNAALSLDDLNDIGQYLASKYGLTWTAPTVVDTFDRADNATTLGTTETGQSWSNNQGTGWGVSSNQAYPIAATDPQISTFDSGLADFTLNVTLKALPSIGSGGGHAGIIFRYVDNSNYWYTQATGNTTLSGAPRYDIYKVVSGTHTEMDTDAADPVVGDVMTVVASGSSIDVKINGTTRLSVSDSAHSTATKIGFRHGGGSPASERFDNLSVTA